jgi:hypothetical protein
MDLRIHQTDPNPSVGPAPSYSQKTTRSAGGRGRGRALADGVRGLNSRGSGSDAGGAPVETISREVVRPEHTTQKDG